MEARTDAVRLEMRGAPLTSLAYRSERGESPEEESPEEESNEVFVDFGPDGSPRIVRRTGDRTSSEHDRHALISTFPLPEQALGGARISESFPIPGTAEVDGVIVQTFERTAMTSTEVRVRWVRQVRAARPTFFALPDTIEETRSQCDATYDRRAGRYSEVRCAAGADDERSVTTLRFDPELSRQRTAMLVAMHRREEAGARGLDGWEAAHPLEREIREALALLPGDRGMMATVFFLRAAPAEVMRVALELPSGELGAFFRGPAVLWLDHADLSDETVALVRRRLARDPDLAKSFCRRHDERFRPELTRLAASRDEYVADAARRTLAGLDLVRRGPSRLRDLRDPGALSGLSPLLLEDGRLSEWIPALIDLLAAHEGEENDEEEEDDDDADDDDDGEAWRRAIAALLGELGVPNLGATAGPWRTWWASHRNRSPVEWAVEDLSSPVIMSRMLGAARLSNLEPGEEGREVLARALRDPEMLVRLTAARCLGQLGDRRAASILVEDMIHGDGGFKLSFAALAGLHGTTLGFDPLAAETDRAEAAGRWQEWSRRIAAASR